MASYGIKWHSNGIIRHGAGFGAQVMRDVPFYASFFGSYEVLGRLLGKAKGPGEGVDTALTLLAGGLGLG